MFLFRYLLAITEIVMRPIRPFSFHCVLYRSPPYNTLTNTIANTIIITIEPTNSTAVTTTPLHRPVAVAVRRPPVRPVTDRPRASSRPPQGTRRPFARVGRLGRVKAAARAAQLSLSGHWARAVTGRATCSICYQRMVLMDGMVRIGTHSVSSCLPS